MSSETAPLSPGAIKSNVPAEPPAPATATTTASLAEKGATIAAGGALLALGLARRSAGGLAAGAAGAALVLRGALAKRPITGLVGGRRQDWRESGTMQFAKSVTIARDPTEVYAFWHDLANLPRFMRHLDAVTVTGPRTSHWIASIGPAKRVEWDAEITDERPNALIAWRSLPEADVRNDGVVRFVPAPGGRGTEVHVTITYRLTAGPVSGLLARATNAIPAQQVKDDLHRMKGLLEAGEVATTDGQSSGRIG